MAEQLDCVQHRCGKLDGIAGRSETAPRRTSTLRWPMVLIRSHDALFRFVFGEPEQMAELLRSNLPAAVAAAIDWGSLRRLDGSFVDTELQERHADLLFEARIGARPLLLFVLVEHKSADDPLTAFQLLRYVVRVHDRWRQEHPQARALPPVLPFVVHHGDAAWSAPRSVRALVELEGLPAGVAVFLRELQPELTFLLDDLAAASEASLDARQLSAVADLFVRFLQFLRQEPAAGAPAKIASWQALLERLLRHGRGQQVLAALLSWFMAGSPAKDQTLRAAMARIHDPTTSQTMKSALDELLDRGREEGLERGLLEGRRDLLRHLLTTRFGTLPPEADAQLRASGIDQLETWATRILTAASVEDVFGPR
jgi:predicted transposase YdaD